MQSKMLFFTILVAVHVNYIYSLEPETCENDIDFITKLSHSGNGIIPILLIEKKKNLLGETTMKIMTDLFSENRIQNMLIVPADQCFVTSSVLSQVNSTKLVTTYPSVFYVKGGQLYPKKFNSLTHYSLNISLGSLYKWKVVQTDQTFAKVIRSNVDNFSGWEIGRGNDLPVQSVIPSSDQPTRQLKTQWEYLTPGTQTIGTTSTSGWSQMNTESFYQRRPSQSAINLAQTSASNWSTGALQPTTWARAPVSDSTVQQPDSTWTINPGRSIFPTIKSSTSKTLNLFDDKPTRPVKTPLRTQTQNQLSGMEQNWLQQDQNYYSGGSTFATTQTDYLRHADESNGNKRRKTSFNFIPIVDLESDPE